MAGLGDLVKFLDRKVATAFDRAARETARQVVDDLRFEGPWWTGEFARAWEVRVGDVDIPADRGEAFEWNASFSERTSRQQLPSVTIPEISGRQAIFKNRYTIGNRMRYRDIALDLAPGRIKGGGNETAPQDWYVLYASGGRLDRAIKLASEPVFRAIGFR